MPRLRPGFLMRNVWIVVAGLVLPAMLAAQSGSGEPPEPEQTAAPAEELTSDADSDVTERYGAWVEKSMYGRKYMGIERATFLVDGDGVIRQAWRKVKVTGHVAAVLKAAKSV